MKKKFAPEMTAPDFTFDSPWKKSLSFYDFPKGKNTVLMFLRYMGCPICQMKIAEIKNDWDEFKKNKLDVLVVLQSDAKNVIGINEIVKENDLPFTIVLDPKEEIFKLYGVLPGSFFRYVTPAVIKKALKSKKLGFKHGINEGKEMQLPAVFIVDKQKKIKYAYYGKNVSDVPENRELLDIAAKL